MRVLSLPNVTMNHHGLARLVPLSGLARCFSSSDKSPNFVRDATKQAKEYSDSDHQSHLEHDRAIFSGRITKSRVKLSALKPKKTKGIQVSAPSKLASGERLRPRTALRHCGRNLQQRIISRPSGEVIDFHQLP